MAGARAMLEKAEEIAASDRTVALAARIRVMHGNELVASTDDGFDKACEDFATWIATHVESQT